MKNEKVSLMRNDEILIAPLRGELNDRELEEFQSYVLERAQAEDRLRGVIIDVSTLCSMDLFTARIIIKVVSMLELMDLKTVIVGFRPEVALTLINIDVPFHGIATAMNLERGIALLKRATKDDSKRN